MDDRVEHHWEKGWQGHEEAQLRRMARWSLREKIRWLEETAKVVEHLRKQAGPAQNDKIRSDSQDGL